MWMWCFYSVYSVFGVYFMHTKNDSQVSVCDVCFSNVDNFDPFRLNKIDSDVVILVLLSRYFRMAIVSVQRLTTGC